MTGRVLPIVDRLHLVVVDPFPGSRGDFADSPTSSGSVIEPRRTDSGPAEASAAAARTFVIFRRCFWISVVRSSSTTPVSVGVDAPSVASPLLLRDAKLPCGLASARGSLRQRCALVLAPPRTRNWEIPCGGGETTSHKTYRGCASRRRGAGGRVPRARGRGTASTAPSARGPRGRCARRSRSA